MVPGSMVSVTPSATVMLEETRYGPAAAVRVVSSEILVVVKAVGRLAVVVNVQVSLSQEAPWLSLAMIFHT